MKLEPAPNGYTCPDDPGEPGLGVQRWSVSDVEARTLSELCRNLTVLEIGTGLGVSTRAIASTAKHVHTVDVDEWVEKTVVSTLSQNVTFYRNTDDLPKGLDAAFIDGLHYLEQCLADIETARRVVKPGGLIIFHDANMKEVHEAIIESEIECYLIQTPCGIAFGWNEEKK